MFRIKYDTQQWEQSASRLNKKFDHLLVSQSNIFGDFSVVLIAKLIDNHRLIVNLVLRNIEIESASTGEYKLAYNCVKNFFRLHGDAERKYLTQSWLIFLDCIVSYLERFSAYTPTHFFHKTKNIQKASTNATLTHEIFSSCFTLTIISRFSSRF